MASGIIASLSANTKIIYTPTLTTKLRITAAGNPNYGSVDVNSVTVLRFGSTVQCGSADLYCAPNIPITISTDSYTTAIVSALEGN